MCPLIDALRMPTPHGATSEMSRTTERSRSAGASDRVKAFKLELPSKPLLMHSGTALFEHFRGMTKLRLGPLLREAEADFEQMTVYEMGMSAAEVKINTQRNEAQDLGRVRDERAQPRRALSPDAPPHSHPHSLHG